jgi:hypothetical protein
LLSDPQSSRVRGFRRDQANTMADFEQDRRFELTRLLDYSNNAIIDELRRVAHLVPDRPITASLFSEHSRVDRNTVAHRFGSWVSALKAAGLGDRLPNGAGNHVSRDLSDEQVIQALRDLAAQLGKVTLTVSDVEAHLPFGRATLIRRWGTSHAAFKAAGLLPSRSGRRYEDVECLDNLLSVWTHYSRQPNFREMGLPPSRVPASAYVRRFGSWMKALSAFVTLINADQRKAVLDPDLEISKHQPIPASSPSEITPDTPDADRRISLGLRFRVLHRDHFKCVLCGDHPARNPDCMLHVDHVIPWSRGGKSRESNLRTLCARCNIGRGDRFVD